ncbi:tetratricopeptide repeat protein [Streptomyces sp. 184]|uniref:tetratricopeptide repeat protein n=1 Tax=Streptomyces sp. 184 TaxID=1827526 RepID=UPI003892CBCE
MTEQAAPHRFVGRTRELDALRADIARAGLDTLAGRPAPRSRVLLIAGRPGSGRSALAAELARDVAGDYPGGVHTARLSGPGGEAVPLERAVRDLLDALGVPPVAGAGPEHLAGELRAALAERSALLVLDDVTAPEQLLELVPESRDCLVVAVAEGPLKGVPDVRPCTLGGLEPAAALALVASYAGETRIACDPEATHVLAEECAGHPAALVLAGGWLAGHPQACVADAVRELRRKGDSTEGSAGRPSGPKALARAFRLVYEALPPQVAHLLRLLPLAPAGLVDAHSASALAGCTVAAARTTLADCARQGLLRRVPQPRPEAEGEEEPEQESLTQYEVPGCLQPLLRGVLEAGAADEEVLLARARMLERYVRLLQSCRAVTEPAGSAVHARLAGLPRALRFPSPEAAAAWLRSRLPSLLAGARMAVADGELDTLARRLVAALSRALGAHRGEADAAPEQYRLHELVLGVAERRGLVWEQAAALLNLGDLDLRAERPGEALGRYQGALAAAREARDPQPVGRALESVGAAYQELRDWGRAADWFGRALALRQTRGELADEARLRARLGAVHTYAGAWGWALREWRGAVAAHRRLGDVGGQARALGEVARVQMYAGYPREAIRTCTRAMDMARLLGDTALRAAVQLRLADLVDGVGDPGAAELHRAAAERLAEQVPEAAEGPVVVPVAEPEAEPRAEGAAAGPDLAREPDAEPASEPLAKPVSEPVSEPVPEPVPVPERTADAAPGGAGERAPEGASEDVGEAAPEAVPDDPAEPVLQPVEVAAEAVADEGRQGASGEGPKAGPAPRPAAADL